ncbi:polyhydroxyalkanoate granule-associated phasin [Cupriavidus sp. UYPR2.512]|uniref:polyhydroxyalkanoate granule-associated phasin n=1 Tax=Cupriavidus sp. UYPR2.512 TaxID=1080187 RepID=UPI00037DC9D9|nr:polyhydroxyalkanoate granule-associated phasin [Cupriavidus sp. UYPR2.512]UIF91778.1 phasin family protein [Cupriavidus necator]
MMTTTQAFWPLSLWPFPTFFSGVHQFEAIQADLADNWRRMTELNLEFTRTMYEELQFDAMGTLVAQEPEALYAREIASELPLIGGPLHYASAMLELYARAQQRWIDGWGHLLTRGLMPDWQGMQRDVTDIPFWLVRETPRPA